jgi:hypothetical protein
LRRLAPHEPDLEPHHAPETTGARADLAGAGFGLLQPGAGDDGDHRQPALHRRLPQHGRAGRRDGRCPPDLARGSAEGGAPAGAGFIELHRPVHPLGPRRRHRRPAHRGPAAGLARGVTAGDRRGAHSPRPLRSRRGAHLRRPALRHQRRFGADRSAVPPRLPHRLVHARDGLGRSDLCAGIAGERAAAAGAAPPRRPDHCRGRDADLGARAHHACAAAGRRRQFRCLRAVGRQFRPGACGAGRRALRPDGRQAAAQGRRAFRSDPQRVSRCSRR